MLILVSCGLAGGGARAGDSDSFLGDALVRVDGQGRIVLAMTRWNPGEGDAIPDERLARVFLFTPAEPMQAGQRLSLPQAVVTHEHGALRAASALNGRTVELLLDRDPAVERNSSGLVVTGGLGIVEVHGDFGNAGYGLDLISTDEWTGVVVAGAGGGGKGIQPSCPAGGAGSTHCAISCAGGLFGGHLALSCEADCKDGFHACCTCADDMMLPHCFCVADDPAAPPKTVKPTT
jgi:hypothetical protein